MIIILGEVSLGKSSSSPQRLEHLERSLKEQMLIFHHFILWIIFSTLCIKFYVYKNLHISMIINGITRNKGIDGMIKIDYQNSF